jgi:predicted acetyltransferase
VKKHGPEGYIYHVYGHSKYLRHAVASALTIKWYDRHREIALLCEEKHKTELSDAGYGDLFDVFLFSQYHFHVVIR